ncbi:hypothetical protein SLU01_06510 [Sporosarcina luteola]|uniref:MPN domain-containing protein n=1 Tax=Sporosarcina luteola TaxID=582850 RepID=A0A511Z4H0_9BACL|nr:hypothetical protein SLU01_06510 [Sporosarcina luteola]
MEGSSWKPSIAIYQGTGFSPYYREAVKRSAASIIVAHNHPSGNPAPSPEDIEVTKRLVEAGNIIGIELLDHVIIGDHRFISLKEKGYMN